MVNVSGGGTVWNCPNYIGELYNVGNNQTPFLNMLGGINGGGIRVTNSWEFPVAQTWALETASQPAITETASLTAPTATTYVRSQDVNVCQIFQKSISLSYARLSDAGKLSGLAISGQIQPVQDELSFQQNAGLKQIAVDLEYTLLNGVYNKATNAATANKMAGIISACTTNTVAAGTNYLTKKLIDQLLRTMAASGADFENMVLFANAFQISTLSGIYGYAPQDRTVGGVAVKQILTDFCNLAVQYTPKMPTTSILIADMNKVSLVGLPVPQKGILFYEPLSKTGAGETGQLYGQLGLAYGPEEMHGTITGLKDA
jgi:hypothetical protein